MQGPKWPVLLIIIVYETLCGHWCCLGQVLYLSRGPRTKGERCQVNRHSRVFRWLTGCQRTPRFWGVAQPSDVYQLGSFRRLISYGQPSDVVVDTVR